MSKDPQDEEKIIEEATKESVNDIAQLFLKELKEVPENTLEIEVIENPDPKKEGKDKYLMVVKPQTPDEHQTEDTDGEVLIKAFRQRGKRTKEESQVKEEDAESEASDSDEEEAP